MRFVIDDGGRSAAGFKGSARDCVTRAIAIATGMPYREVYDVVNSESESANVKAGKTVSSSRSGVRKEVWKTLLNKMGWTWTPTMGIGTGCKVHLRSDELPGGTLIVSVSRHMVAVIDGVAHDTEDCSRDGTRCVYGYWKREV